jgi:hypothetical protein
MASTCSLKRLPNAEEVALAIAEPSSSFAYPTVGRVIPFYISDPVYRFEAGKIVFFERDSTLSQLTNGCLDVIDLPGHLCVST